jgi:hypothetical protein
VISPGIAEGMALVCREPIGFNFSVDINTGIILEEKHSIQNRSISGKILVFPHGKGSTGGSFVVYQLAKAGTGPLGMINLVCENIIACGAIMGGIPVMDCLDRNPLEVIEDGDFVKIDTARGEVTVEKRS